MVDDPSLLSGAGTKSDGGACGKSSQASQHHNVDLQPPPSDPSPGPDVREALEESSQTLEYLRREARTWGKIFSVNVDHVLDKNRKALSALTRPLGGFVQGSIADGGQCNEHSVQGLSDPELFRQQVNAAYDLLAAKERHSGCTSYIQRNLHVGYNRACNILEELERRQVITAPNAAGLRQWLGKKPAVAETDADAQLDDGLLSGVPSAPDHTTMEER